MMLYTFNRITPTFTVLEVCTQAPVITFHGTLSTSGPRPPQEVGYFKAEPSTQHPGALHV